MRTPTPADVLAAIATAALLTPSLALGYVDPGMGALVWQGVIAAIAGSFFLFRRSYATAARWVRRTLRFDRTVSRDGRADG